MQKSTFTPEYAAFCKLLREHRERAGLSQVELAKKIDETQSYVSKVERGERRLDLVQLRYFCKALGVGLAQFVEAFERAAVGRRLRSLPSAESFLPVIGLADYYRDAFGSAREAELEQAEP